MGWKERAIELNGAGKRTQEIVNLLANEYPDEDVTHGMVRSYIRRTEDRDKPKKKRIMTLSDQHYPFLVPGYYDYIAPYRNKVDTLVFVGDEEDAQSISKFRKKYRVHFVDEMIGAREMIRKTIELINPVETVIIPGNHNYRFINYMSDRVHDDVLELMPETNLDLIIDDGFYKYDHENKSKTFFEPLKSVYGNRLINAGEWFYRIGKTIFAHPQAYRKADLGTADIVYRYFKDRDFVFDTLVLAHTHRMGWAPRGETSLFECGCMCDQQEYAQKPPAAPQQNGFAYIVQDENGNLIFEESRLIWLTPFIDAQEDAVI
jgi:predicted phosphodiesterase